MELLGKSLEELRAYCKSIGEPEYRGGQIFHALYAERKFNVAEMTNLPGALREKLPREASSGPGAPINRCAWQFWAVPACIHCTNC